MLTISSSTTLKNAKTFKNWKQKHCYTNFYIHLLHLFTKLVVDVWQNGQVLAYVIQKVQIEATFKYTFHRLFISLWVKLVYVNIQLDLKITLFSNEIQIREYLKYLWATYCLFSYRQNRLCLGQCQNLNVGIEVLLMIAEVVLKFLPSYNVFNAIEVHQTLSVQFSCL